MTTNTDITVLSSIGDPPASVLDWLEHYAADNEGEALRAFWPWRKAYYLTRARAFYEAADLLRRAAGLPEVHLAKYLR